jgi:hypothetical protein
MKRYLGMPSDFHYHEVVRLLGYFDFVKVGRGKTSGSGVKFINSEGVVMMLHRPHPSGTMKQYQLKQIKEVLGI